MGGCLEIMEDEESRKVGQKAKLSKRVQFVADFGAETQRLWADMMAGSPGAYDALLGHVDDVLGSFHRIRDAPGDMWLRQASLDRAGDCLVRSGTVDVLCEIVCLAVTRTAMTCAGDALAALANFAHVSEQVCMAAGQHPSLLTNLRDYLASQTSSGKLQRGDDHLSTTLCLALLDNVASRDSSVQFARSVPGVFEVASIYVSDDTIPKFLAIKLMATVATEQQAETMTQDDHILHFVLHQLRASLRSRDGAVPFDGNIHLTTVTFANAVKQLSRNEANSQQLVELGVLPLLYEGLRSNSHQDRNECIEALWWLSFNKRNRTAIAREASLMRLVAKISHSSHDSCRLAAGGILFQMRNADSRAKKYMSVKKKANTGARQSAPASSHVTKDDVNPARPTPPPEQSDSDQSGSGHVMLSYQTGSRQLVKTVCDFLKSQGISVWMDIYDMAEGETSTAQTMAEAVEKAAVVLMGVSEGYKNSQYCRSEAEYAFENQKRIIPLKLQRGYKPDGWLGFIQGSKYFFDLTKDEVRDQKLKQLLKAVQKAYDAANDGSNTETGSGDGDDDGGGGGGDGGGGGGGASTKQAEGTTRKKKQTVSCFQAEES